MISDLLASRRICSQINRFSFHLHGLRMTFDTLIVLIFWRACIINIDSGSYINIGKQCRARRPALF